MKFQEVRRLLMLLGITIKRTYGEEYRVNLKGGSEATAYYTPDLDDAYGTGVGMAEYLKRKTDELDTRVAKG